METHTFDLWLQISALGIGAALATVYAVTRPDTRARSAIVTIVLAGLAMYRFTQLP
jgi:hypothetical protein